MFAVLSMVDVPRLAPVTFKKEMGAVGPLSDSPSSEGLETCAECGKSLFKPSYCKLCGRPFCSKHVAPQSHSCPQMVRRARKGSSRRPLALVGLGLLVIIAAALGIHLSRSAGKAGWNGTTVFTDVTLQAGVGDTGSGHGLALADVDGDGDIDIYVVNKNGPNVLYRNDGNGSFTDITEISGAGDFGPGHGAVFLDYDNDGDLDLYVANWGGKNAPNRLYRNEGNGTFTDVSDQSGISKMRAGASHGCIALDFDADGFCDIFASSAEEPPILLHNNGDGTFEDYSEKAGLRSSPRPHFLSAVDFDEDGDCDIMVSNSDPSDGDADAPNQFYVNTGRGTFVELAERTGLLKGDLHGACFGDFNGDGHIDLLAPDAARGSRMNFLLNDGRGRFHDSTRRSKTWHTQARTHGMACGDFDNDGDLDAFLTSRDGNLLFANDGTGVFVEVSEKTGLAQPHGDTKAAAFFDYDNDGDLDLYVVVHNGMNRLFRNDGTTGNWLAVKLLGTRSNRDGIGARIEVRTGSGLQVREVIGGKGHMQDPLVQFFGLGQASAAESVTIRWPSGRVQTLRSVEANQVLVVEEKA